MLTSPVCRPHGHPPRERRQAARLLTLHLVVTAIGVAVDGLWAPLLLLITASDCALLLWSLSVHVAGDDESDGALGRAV